MSEEETVDDGTRRAVLEALVAKQKQKEVTAIPSSTSLDEIDETTSFEVLLEKSLENRGTINEDEIKAQDDVRDRAIKESSVDMVDDIMKRLL